MPTGKDIVATANKVAKDYKDRKVTYVMGGDASGGGKTSDCSHFVHDVLKQAGLQIPYTTTEGMASSTLFDKVDADKAQAGDVIVQGGHVGVYTGEKDGKGHPLGVQMGNHGPATGPWGPGGWFANPKDLRFYHPKTVQ